MELENRFTNEGTATQAEICSSKNRATMKCGYSYPFVLKTGGISFPSYTPLLRSFLGMTLVSSDKELV